MNKLEIIKEDKVKTKSFKQKLLDARKKINNPKRGGKDNYKKRKYVTLQDLYDVVLPSLLEEGLLLINAKEYKDENYFLKTQILDVDSDESVETSAMLNQDIKIQEQGSELTYHSRYNLGCLLSIRTDYDDDAESIKDKEVKKKAPYQSGSQNDSVLDKRSEKEVKELIDLFNQLPTYRKEIEKFLVKKEIREFEDMPKGMYAQVFKAAKTKVKEIA